jgi:hypothetical protein
MIKKNTKIVFEDGKNIKTENIAGGIPLSKGEIVRVHDDNSDGSVDYEVVDKITNCFMKSGNQTVNIKYVLRKK